MDRNQKSYFIGGVIIIVSPIVYVIGRALYSRKATEVEELKIKLTEENTCENESGNTPSTTSTQIFGKRLMDVEEGKTVFICDLLGKKRFSFIQKEESVIGQKKGNSIVNIQYVREGNNSLDEACTEIIKPYYRLYLLNILLSIGIFFIGSGQIASKYFKDKDLIRFIK